MTAGQCKITQSINKILALLSRILDDAVERGYLRDNPGRRRSKRSAASNIA